MTTQSESFLMTFTNEDHAYDAMRRRNAHRAGTKPGVVVLVDGPEDGEWSIMDIRTAIKGGFLYSWA